MSTYDVELAVNRKNTAVFIAARPSSIALIPSTKERLPSTGFKWVDGDPRDAQTMRIIELGMQSSPPVLVLGNGTQRQVRFWLLGLHDAVMETNDWWAADDGREWQIGDVVRSNGYEVRGLVVERGD